MVLAGGTYKQFAIGGLLAMNLTTATLGTAVGISQRPLDRCHRPVPHPPDRTADPGRPDVSDLLAWSWPP